MNTNRILEELYQIKADLARECDFDIHKICQRAQAEQIHYANRLVGRDEIARRREANKYALPRSTPRKRIRLPRDPIVEEIHRIRRELMAECGNDIHKFFERMREGEREHPERLVQLRTEGKIRRVKQLRKPGQKAAKRT